MQQRFVLAMLVVATLTACYGPNREPGDDASRSDEGPTAGRPASDPHTTAFPKDQSGGGAPDQMRTPEDERGTLDGTSDELGGAEPPPH